MAKPATAATSSANDDYSGWQKSALSGYNSDVGSYMSNVNSTLAAGNPYDSKSYKTDQNLETSGAMHSTADAGAQQLRDTALRTGTNTAAVAGGIAKNAQDGQRQLTQYNAGRDTANEDKWLQQKDGLMGMQLQGANSEAGVLGAATTGRDSALGDMTSIQNSQDEDWTKLGTSAMQGAGTGLTAAFA